MRKIVLPTAYVVIIMDLIQSCVHMYAYASCNRGSSSSLHETRTFENCDQVQPWVLNGGIFVYFIQFLFAILVIIGIFRIKGKLIKPWVVFELVLLTHKITKAQYYAFFYPIWSVNDEYEHFEFIRVYMETYLEFTAEIVAWFLICNAHDEMLKKRKKKKLRRKPIILKGPRVQPRKDAY